MQYYIPMNNSRISLKAVNLMGKKGWEGHMPVPVVQKGVNRSVLTWPYVKTEESENNKGMKFHEIEDYFIWLYLAKNKVGYLKRKSMIF